MNVVNEKLHLGCGPIILKGWINVDLDSPTADINLDLTQKLPFNSGSVSRIFSEHFIEHVTRSQAVDFLIECKRILSSDGIIRISTPNLKFLIASYIDSDLDAWGDLWRPGTKCALMNEGMRSWGHQYVYDADELISIFKEAGFSSLAFKKYRDSDYSDLIGLESRPFHHELIIEAKNCDGLFEVDYSSLLEDEQSWLSNLESVSVLSKTIAMQAEKIVNAEKEMAVRAEKISELTKLINATNVELNMLKEKWYRKMFRKIYKT